MNLSRIFASVFVGGLVTASTIVLLNQWTQKNKIADNTPPNLPDTPESEETAQKPEKTLSKRKKTTLSDTPESEKTAQKPEKTLLKEKKSTEKTLSQAKVKKQRAKRTTEPATETGELHKGFKVFQGAQGGRFYLDAKGIKKYLKPGE